MSKKKRWFLLSVLFFILSVFLLKLDTIRAASDDIYSQVKMAKALILKASPKTDSKSMAVAMMIKPMTAPMTSQR